MFVDRKKGYLPLTILAEEGNDDFQPVDIDDIPSTPPRPNTGMVLLSPIRKLQEKFDGRLTYADARALEDQVCLALFARIMI